MKRFLTVFAGLFMLAVSTTNAQAVMISHGGTTIDMDFVTVGNPGNAGELSGAGAGGHGPDAIVGAVDYSYNIGKYEVTGNQWDAVVAASATDLLNDPSYWSGDRPATAISWSEAAMFCNWLTSGDVTDGAYTTDGSGVVTGIDRVSAINAHGTVYVIPTEDEWYKAAYYDPGKPGGAGYWDYPTMDDAPNPPDGLDFRGDTRFDAVFSEGFASPAPNYVDDTGVLGPYGTMGQGGNVQEWTETMVTSSLCGLRGGAWLYVGSAGLTASSRLGLDPSREPSYVGFRVASVVPEPGTITLLLCGLVCLTLIRRR